VTWQERIQQLAQKRRGRITPREVVDDARDDASPLHPLFEWNDGIAADRYREEQARVLIGRVRIEIEVVDIGAATSCSVPDVVRRLEGGAAMCSVPALVRDMRVDSGDQGYASIGSIRRSEANAQKTMAYYLAQVDGMLVRCERLAIGLGIDADLVGARQAVARALVAVSGE